MERRITSWQSPALGMEMPLVAYGHAGYPVLMFPTAAADFLEYERFHLISSIQHLIESGRMRAYSINSVNRYSLMNEQAPPWVKADLLSRYDRYITDAPRQLGAPSFEVSGCRGYALRARGMGVRAA